MNNFESENYILKKKLVIQIKMNSTILRNRHYINFSFFLNIIVLYKKYIYTKNNNGK